jgi:HEAT repeat protein
MSVERLEQPRNDCSPACPATAPKLETLEDAQRFLQEALHFADALERWEAIEQVCTQFDCEALVEYLLPFLNDPDPLVRVNAIDALESIPQPQIDVHLFSPHYLFVIKAAHALEDSVDVLEQEMLEALEGVLRERLVHWRSVASAVEALEPCLEAVQLRKKQCCPQNSSTSPSGGSGASSSTPT